MNELQQIEGFNTKIYGTAENPLFLAKDIAEVLEHSRASEMLKSVDEDEKLMQTILASGQNREMWFLTEDGLYEVLMTSRKPQAKLFKKKVKEILKTIRHHGAYITNQKAEDILFGNGLGDLLLQAGNQIKKLESEKAEMQLDLAEARERTRYLDLIFESKDDVLITQIAQDYGMGAPSFNRLLASLRIQRKVNNQWILYSKYQAKGFIKSRTHSFVDSKGQMRTNITTTWTQKGREFLYRKLKKAGYLPEIEREDMA